ncbi:hypothetical protein MTP99_018338 [Tenebrio molitor]|nr:hypothetical protein MTP99_018338 [Tenebrio molitor]
MIESSVAAVPPSLCELTLDVPIIFRNGGIDQRPDVGRPSSAHSLPARPRRVRLPDANGRNNNDVLRTKTTIVSRLWRIVLTTVAHIDIVTSFLRLALPFRKLLIVQPSLPALVKVPVEISLVHADSPVPGGLMKEIKPSGHARIFVDVPHCPAEGRRPTPIPAGMRSRFGKVATFWVSPGQAVIRLECSVCFRVSAKERLGVSFFPMRITTSAESLSEETGADKVLDDLKRQHLESFFAPA